MDKKALIVQKPTSDNRKDIFSGSRTNKPLIHLQLQPDNDT